VLWQIFTGHRSARFPLSSARRLVEFDTSEFARCSCTLFFFYKNVVFPAQAEYSYFSADFRLKLFLY